MNTDINTTNDNHIELVVTEGDSRTAPTESEIGLPVNDLGNDPQLEELSSVRNKLRKKEHIHSIGLLLSQYGWFILCVLPIAYGFFFPSYHPSKVYTSKNATMAWNSSSLPTIFTHATDIHLAAVEPPKIINARYLLKSMKAYHADFNLITGDVVDSYGKVHWPKIGHQVREDWDLWHLLVEEDADNFEILDVAGNHDMWAIIDPLSDQNMFLDYSYTYTRNNTPTLHDFYVRTLVRHGITFVLVNQYRFPDVHPPYTYWAHPNKEFLDALEAEIKNAGPCYVVMHYPVDYNWNVRSSQGHTFEQIMQKENVEIIFSGHFHPYDPMIVHHGQGGVEYVGIGAYQMKGYGLVTIDNGRFVYTTIRLTEPETKYILTHPIPLEQLSSHQVFNENNTEIRLLSYESSNATITITGSVNGIMNYSTTLPNGAHLYTYPLNVPVGRHQITLTGDGCNITRTFYIGEQYRGEKDLVPCYKKGFLLLKLTSIPVYLLVLRIVFPMRFAVFSSTEEWIEGKQSDRTLLHWVNCIFFGPFLLHQRVQQLPKSIRYILLAAVLYPLCGPNHIFKAIHGHIGYSFAGFVVIAGTILYDEWAVHMTYFYIMTILIPVIFYASSAKFIGKSWVFYFNWGFSLLMWGLVQITNYRWCGESVIVPNLFLNPTFVIIPLILQICVYCIVVRKSFTSSLVKPNKS